MKDWTIPLLRSIRPEGISEESYEETLKTPVFVWRLLGNLFFHEFDNDTMIELLGSVLSDLPRSDFDKLFALRPFFILVRGVAIAQQLHAMGDVPLIIFCQTDLKNMSFEQKRATIAHELAHTILGHLSRPFSLDDPFKEKMQNEADDLCRTWGFEIDNVREYLKKQREEDYGKNTRPI